MAKRDLFPKIEMDMKFSKIFIFSNQCILLEIKSFDILLQNTLNSVPWHINWF